IFTANEDIEVTVAFDDSIAEDKAAEIDKQVKLVQAELQSRVRAIMDIFGITEDEALKVIKEIADESRQMMPEPPDDSHLFGDREYGEMLSYQGFMWYNRHNKCTSDTGIS